MVERIVYDFLEYWVPDSMLVMGGIVVIMETVGGMRAAYGRYNKSNLGLRAPIAWFFQESPAFIVPLLICIYRRPFLFDILGRLNTNTILLGFFMFHYFHRSFIYTLRIKSDKRVNYMENIMAFIFCTVNGLQIGHYHTFYPNNALSNWNFWLGSVLFWVGLIINIDSDYRLIRLRSSTTSKSTTSSPSKSAYKIPQGGLFEYVSAANYSGECLEWLGFALASWSLPGLAFSWFTFSNIGPRAYHHHLYYKELFGAKYPKNRKALIPFLL